DRAAGGVQDIDSLTPAVKSPIETVESDLVRISVRETQIDGEAGGRKPGGGYAIRGGGLLRRPRVGGARRPGEGGLPSERDLDPGGVAGGIVGNGFAIDAVESFPGSLRGTVGPDKGRRRWRRKEDSTNHGVWTAGKCDSYREVTGQIPCQVQTA